MPPDLRLLYDAHAGALFGFVLNLTRNEADTRDVLQEVFLKVARHPDQLVAVRDARAWLLRLAHHLAIDRLRRCRAGERALERVTAESTQIFAASSDPDEAAFRSALADALVGLPAEQRAVVHLKLWEDLTFAEIAETLDIPPNTAASRYRYGIDKLQALLRPLYEELR
jgi:RNA polymerase sigma-70 factor (ECF subfamily)